MNIGEIFSGIDFVGILFLIGSALFTIGYVTYAFVFYQRLKRLHITYHSPQNRHLFVLGLIQIAIAALLVGYILLFFLFRLTK